MTNPDERDCEYQPAPVCPYCGHVDHDWAEWLGADEDFDIACGTCGEDYTGHAHISIMFSTKEAKDNKC